MDINQIQKLPQFIQVIIKHLFKGSINYRENIFFKEECDCACEN